MGPGYGTDGGCTLRKAGAALASPHLALLRFLLVHEFHEGPRAADVGEGDLAQALKLGVCGVLVSGLCSPRCLAQVPRREEALVCFVQLPVFVLASLRKAQQLRLKTQIDALPQRIAPNYGVCHAMWCAAEPRQQTGGRMFVM